MAEFFFNSKENNYTLKEELKGVKSIKKIPMKFKLEDSTSKYRKEILEKEILEKYNK